MKSFTMRLQGDSQVAEFAFDYGLKNYPASPVSAIDKLGVRAHTELQKWIDHMKLVWTVEDLGPPSPAQPLYFPVAVEAQSSKKKNKAYPGNHIVLPEAEGALMKDDIPF